MLCFLCTCFAFFPQATCIYHLYVLAFQWRKGNGAWRMQELINKNQIPKMHQRSDVIAQQFKLIWFEYKLNYSDKTLMLSPPFSLKSSLCQQACSSSPLYRTKIMDKIYNTKRTTLFFSLFSNSTKILQVALSIFCTQLAWKDVHSS